MKTLKFSLFLTLSIFFTLTIVSCGGSSSGPGGVDCDDSIAVNNAISDEVEAISLALNAYIMDASASNCDNLKSAYQDYVDALKSLQDCANDAGVGAEFAQSLSDAEANIADLLCLRSIYFRYSDLCSMVLFDV